MSANKTDLSVKDAMIFWFTFACGAKEEKNHAPFLLRNEIAIFVKT